jgi:hypothetical protein
MEILLEEVRSAHYLGLRCAKRAESGALIEALSRNEARR